MAACRAVVLVAISLAVLSPSAGGHEGLIENSGHSAPQGHQPVIGIRTTCSPNTLNITVGMRQPFRGLVYSRGFPLECSTASRDQHRKRLHQDEPPAHTTTPEPPAEPTVTLVLPASECGVRVLPSEDGDGLVLQTTVVVQLDRHLQQAADQTRTVTCHLSARDSSLLMRAHPAHTHTQRTGRQHGDDIPSADFSEDNALAGWDRARAVMEIVGSAAGRDPGVLAVGEEASLIITSHLPVGMGSQVTDCFAHDGAGEAMERLSDGRGCPTDRLILPQLSEVHSPAQLRALRPPLEEAVQPLPLHVHSPGILSVQYRRRRKRALPVTTQVSAAKFSAFKFPDRSRLHLRCQLQLCRGACRQFDCLEKFNVSRQERRLQKGEVGEVLGRLQVFNSVEVLAPGIEADDRLRLDQLMTEVVSVLPGDRTFCLSPPKMALAFATLGSILLCAVAVALYSLLRGRGMGLGLRAPPMPHAPHHFLRRHFLRLREGSSASLGERNVLVRVQDSPFLGGHPPPHSTPSPTPNFWQDKLFH